jgi:Rrf2 family protein
MKLSRACGYALRALTYLARHGGDDPVVSRQIAEAHGLSEFFLAKALKPLVSARVLRSLRGSRGGVRLARPARDITLLEVVEAVDGPVRGDAPRVGTGGAARLDRRLQAVCDAVAEGVRRRLRKVTLADLAAGKEG